MKSIIALRTFAALSLLILVTACESKKPKESVEIAKEVNDVVLDDSKEEKDADFIVNVIAGNYAEVKLAQLALTRSGDNNVKKMAANLEIDHAKIITELTGYAVKNGITIPLEEAEASKKDYKNLAEEKDVNDFDEKWCDRVADNHEESIKYFERRLDKTEDVELKNWINATLPGLRSHLKMLRENEERLN